jgi:hypothetical protein
MPSLTDSHKITRLVYLLQPLRVVIAGEMTIREEGKARTSNRCLQFKIKHKDRALFLTQGYLRIQMLYIPLTKHTKMPMMISKVQARGDHFQEDQVQRSIGF